MRRRQQWEPIAMLGYRIFRVAIGHSSYGRYVFRRSRGSERSGDDPKTAADTLRPLLYGNLDIDRWAVGDQSGDPWDRFAAARQAFEASDTDIARRQIWSEVAETPGLESRQYLQAWTFCAKLEASQPRAWRSGCSVSWRRCRWSRPTMF